MIAFAAGIEERWGYPTDCRRLLLTHTAARADRGHQLEDYTPLLAAMSAPRVVDEIPTIQLPVAVREKARTRLRTLGVRVDKPLFTRRRFARPRERWATSMRRSRDAALRGWLQSCS
jgi:hypothetical protein